MLISLSLCLRSTRRSLVINSRKLAREQPTLTANNFVWYLMHISAPVSGSETLLNYRCICRGLFMCVKCIDADRYAERAGATRGEERVWEVRDRQHMLHAGSAVQAACRYSSAHFHYQLPQLSQSFIPFAWSVCSVRAKNKQTNRRSTRWAAGETSLFLWKQ